MKRLLTFVFCLTVWTSFGQNSGITIDSFPIEIKCEVDYTHELAIPQGKSPCGEVTVKMTEQFFSGGCLGNLVRTFTYTDTCGNRAEAQQFVTLEDNMEPQLFGVPADITVDENNIPDPVIVSSRDNSGNVYEVFLKQEKNGNVIIRTWTCTDQCGNTVEGIQRITLKK